MVTLDEKASMSTLDYSESEAYLGHNRGKESMLTLDYSAMPADKHSNCSNQIALLRCS